MSWLVPLPVVVPLLAATLVAATDHLVPEAVKEIPPMIAAAAATVFSLLLLAHVQTHDLVHWSGGWTTST